MNIKPTKSLHRFTLRQGMRATLCLRSLQPFTVKLFEKKNSTEVKVRSYSRLFLDHICGEIVGHQFQVYWRDDGTKAEGP